MIRKESMGNLARNFSVKRDVGVEEIFRFHSTDDSARFAGEVVLLSRVAVFCIDETPHRITTAIIDIAPDLQPFARSGRIDERERVGEAVVTSALDDYFAGGLPYSEEAFAAFSAIISNPDEMADLRKTAVEAR